MRNVTYLTFERPCKFMDFKNRMHLCRKQTKTEIPRELREWNAGRTVTASVLGSEKYIMRQVVREH